MVRTAKYLFLWDSILICSSIYSQPCIFLDQSYGPDHNGIVKMAVGAKASVHRVVLQCNGKALVFGTSMFDDVRHIVFARYTSDGLVDMGFGAGGTVTTPLISRRLTASGLVHHDDTVTIVGSSFVNDQECVALARYSGSGELESGFGDGGMVTTRHGNWAAGQAAALQADGNIVVSGIVAQNWSPKIMLARYRGVDGSLDEDFGQAGIVVTAVGFASSAQAIVLQDDGKILVGGRGVVDNHELAVIARYTVTGLLDTDQLDGFGSDKSGVATKFIDGSLSTSVLALGLQHDGKIIVLVSALFNMVPRYYLMRYTSNGILDTTFGINGIVAIDKAYIHGAHALALQPSDDKIVVAGVFDNHPCVLRYAADGSGLDTTFGINGSVITTELQAQAQAVCVQPDGKIIIAGTVTSGDSFFVARYLSTNSDFIVIDSPSDSSTQAGTFTIHGRASRANMRVRVSADATVIATTTTDVNGNWSAGISPVLANGSRSISAELMVGDAVISTATNHITMSSKDCVVITAPAPSAVVDTYAPMITGTATRAATSVRMIIDGAVIATTTTSSLGGWHSVSSRINNGNHTLLAELMDGETVVARATCTFMVSVVSWPGQTDCSNLRVVSGAFTSVTPPIILSGSGDGCPPNCTFAVAQIMPNRYRIDFLPPFFNMPTVVVTAQKSGGDSMSALPGPATRLSMTVDVDAQTDEVHFIAISCHG